MGKNNKNQQNYWDEDFEEDMPASEEFGVDPNAKEQETPSGEESTPASAAEVGAEAIEADFMSTLKKSKKKQDKKTTEEKTENNNNAKPVLKSKKEKEKEKKDKEKQKKKEETNKKKAQQQAQKEKNKELNKQNAEKVAAEKEAKEKSKSESPAPESTKDAKAPPKKGGKKAPAGLAALKRQLELKKQAEEEEQRLREEDERLAQEEEERLAQEERDQEAAKEAKKEKDKAKKEKLKSEGKLLTKKQKEEKKLQEKRRAALLAANNVRVPALDKKETEAPKPKKVVYGKKKPKATDQKTQESKPSDGDINDSDKSGEKKGDEEVLIDDWENLALEDDQGDDAAATTTTTEQTETVEIKESEKSTPEVSTTSEASSRGATKEPSVPTPAAAPAKPTPAAKAVENTARSSPSPPPSQKKDLRSPICCILGHVDTGKTKLLDKIRQSNVQGGEAGGITQQIGATYFPISAVKDKTKTMAKYERQTFDVPGLLVIDTPGHESFTNLRSRGSSLCNIAILVVDIMHGLEPQTLESLRLLRDRKAPFVVALNKIDRLYDWKTVPGNSFRDSFEQQSRSVKDEFDSRLSAIKLALAEQGLNSELYYQNKNMSKYVSIVPSSAVTGEGVPDLLWLLLELTQKRMSKQLMYLSRIEATILEVKVVEGFGTTIDVILSNGYLREGDRIVLCGMNGPIVTNIRALLTPQPLRELRLKSEYVHHKEVKAALGVKIAANDLEKAVSGSRLLVVGPDDDEEEMMDDVMDDLTGLLDSVDTSGRGVTVQASTLGSLEALLDFLKDMKIPVMSIGLGPVFKRDVMKAGAMLEKAPEYAVMMCFDVKIDKEAEQYAEQEGIKMFNADIIYHLFDAFTKYQADLLEQRRKDFLDFAIFPCVLQTLQIINKRAPMIIGVDVMEGVVRVGTPICTVKVNPTTKEKQVLLLGKVVSLEINHQPINEVKRGQTAAGVAMRLEDPSGQQPVWGRHVDDKDPLYAAISRKSIDTLKDKAFRDQVSKSDWLLIKKLKPVFGID